ncbi:MAG: hypothetical protein ACR2NN_10370 [Bryobacteraceae bacterium]
MRKRILQGHRVLYREAHALLEQLAEAVVYGTRKQYVESLATVPLLMVTAEDQPAVVSAIN